MKCIALVPLRNKSGYIEVGQEIEIKDETAAKKLLADKKIKEKK